MAIRALSRRMSVAHPSGVALVVCVPLILAATVVSYRVSASDAGRRLVGITWNLQAVGTTPVDATTRRTPTFELDGHGRFGMNDGTNLSGGSVTVTPNYLRFGDVGSTSAGVGIDQVREAVDAVIAPGSARWRLTGSDLVLSRGRAVLRYHAGTTVTSARLVGTRWQVSMYGSRAAAFNPGHNAGVVLHFVDDHTLVAATACTRLRARYQATPTRLVITGSTVSANRCRHYLSVAALTHVLGDGLTAWDWNGELWLTRGGSGIRWYRADVAVTR